MARLISAVMFFIYLANIQPLMAEETSVSWGNVKAEFAQDPAAKLVVTQHKAGGAKERGIPNIVNVYTDGRYGFGTVAGITWNVSGLSKKTLVRVDLYFGDKKTWVRNLVTNYPVYSQHFDFSTDDIEPNRVYMVKVSTFTRPLIESWSPEFDIVSEIPVVISPVQGDSLNIGGVKNIEWYGTPFPVDVYTIVLVRPDGHAGWGIVGDELINATYGVMRYEWVVGSVPGIFGSGTLPPPGDYYLEIEGRMRNNIGTTVVMGRSGIFNISSPVANDEAYPLSREIESLDVIWDNLWKQKESTDSQHEKELLLSQLGEIYDRRSMLEHQMNNILLMRK